MPLFLQRTLSARLKAASAGSLTTEEVAALLVDLATAGVRGLEAARG